MTPGIIHYVLHDAVVEVSDTAAGSMIWLDLKATLLGIWLFITENGYESRTFHIVHNEEGWVGSGGFHLDPPPASPKPPPA